MIIANPIYDIVFKYLMEDEYYSVIENRDTTIMMKNKEIARQSATIKEQGDTIKEQGDMLCSTIKLLLNAGMTAEQIAVNLHVSVATVEKYSSLS